MEASGEVNDLESSSSDAGSVSSSQICTFLPFCGVASEIISGRSTQQSRDPGATSQSFKKVRTQFICSWDQNDTDRNAVKKPVTASRWPSPPRQEPWPKQVVWRRGNIMCMFAEGDLFGSTCFW